MYNYNKSGLSAYDPTKLAIHSILRPEDNLISNCGPNVEKTVSFDDVVHFNDEENIVTYVDFDCGITFCLKLLQKSDRSTENGITIPDPLKNLSAFPATINMSVLLMSSIALISIWPRTFYGTCLLQLLCHSATLIIHTLCSIKSLNQQLNNLEQTQIRCFLHYKRWTVKGRDCPSALRSFKEITYRTDEWLEQLLRLKNWVISGSLEQKMEFRRLWWTVIAFKCSYLIQLFDFYCLLVQHLLLWKITFSFLFFHDFEWEIKVYWQPLWKLTVT